MEDTQETGSIEPSEVVEPSREEKLAVLDHQIAEATQSVRAATQNVDEAKKALTQVVAAHDVLLSQRDKLMQGVDKHHENVTNYLRSQRELRAKRAQDIQQLKDAGLGKFVDNSPCALDRALAHKPGRGTRRPVRDLIAPNG